MNLLIRTLKSFPSAQWLLLGAFTLLTACGSTKTHTPAALSPVAAIANIGEVWSNTNGARVSFPLQMSVVGQNVVVGGSQGSIAAISSISGRDLWRLKLGADLSSGVGFDGEIAAVTTMANEVIAIQSGSNQGKIVWRQALQARSFTAPLVAGGRVFVLTGDRQVHAFDAATGVRLWRLQRPAEPLVLSQAGTLGVYRNTLLVGGSGRLLGVNPDNGQVQWESSVATTRATNDIERLIDLVGAPHRVGDSICVRAYQTSVACLDVFRGLLLWSKNTQGSVGVSGDAQMVVSTESDGRIKAWNRQTGELLWTNDKLTFRGLSAPLVIGSSVVVGDFEGYVHVINKLDGGFTARFKTDGSAIVAAPVVSGTVVMVATAKGALFAYSPK